MNNEFKWTDELVYEFVKDKGKYITNTDVTKIAIDLFKESKTKKQDKDWEILAIRDELGRLVYTDLLPRKGQTIDTVRRLSDGETFSVGDGFMWGINDTKLIDKIYFDVDCDLIFGGKDFIINGLYAKKSTKKQPLSIKPPLGIIPMKMWRENRLQEIEDAIVRYVHAGVHIPNEWLAERETLLSWLQN